MQGELHLRSGPAAGDRAPRREHGPGDLGAPGVAQQVIEGLGQGAEQFMDSLRYWTQDNALEIELLAHDQTRLDFNVNRCRYAELYRALGLEALGATLSCNRDFALISGFNSQATLERTQTIMQGAAHCDFRYTFPRPQPSTADISPK